MTLCHILLVRTNDNHLIQTNDDNLLMIELVYLTHIWKLKGAINPNQNGPGSNDNQGVLNIPQSYKTGTFLSDAV